MYKRILFSTCMTEYCEHVFTFALNMAKENNAKLWIYHSLGRLNLSEDETNKKIEEAEARVKEAYGNKLIDKGLEDYMINVSDGDIVSEITKLGSSIWLIGFSWMWFNAAFISFLTFSSPFFVAKGYEIGSAGFLSSIIMMGSLFLSPLIGYFVYKFGREEAFIGMGGVILASLIFFVSISSNIIPLLLLAGIFAAFVPASIFSMPSKIVERKNLGLAFGIITACSNIGVLVGPYLAGLARDFAGNYSSSFHLMSLFAVLQTVTIGLFSWAKTKK